MTSYFPPFISPFIRPFDRHAACCLCLGAVAGCVSPSRTCWSAGVFRIILRRHSAARFLTSGRQAPLDCGKGTGDEASPPSLTMTAMRLTLTAVYATIHSHAHLSHRTLGSSIPLLPRLPHLTRSLRMSGTKASAISEPPTAKTPQTPGEADQPCACHARQLSPSSLCAM